jgi:hypothetical protein
MPMHHCLIFCLTLSFHFAILSRFSSFVAMLLLLRENTLFTGDSLSLCRNFVNFFQTAFAVIRQQGFWRILSDKIGYRVAPDHVGLSSQQ